MFQNRKDYTIFHDSAWRISLVRDKFPTHCPFPSKNRMVLPKEKRTIAGPPCSYKLLTDLGGDEIDEKNHDKESP